MTFLFPELNELSRDGPLSGPARERACELVVAHHYTHGVPSGKTYWFAFGGALVAFSIPANRHVGRFLLGRDGVVWELSRLWAPDGHARNLLTQAIAASVGWFRRAERSAEILVSYADPNVGHGGGVYRAASWVPAGQCEESRYYVAPDGRAVARRKFHSGRKFLKKAEIEALGYAECRRPGKLRFARPLTGRARRDLAANTHKWEGAVKAADADGRGIQTA